MVRCRAFSTRFARLPRFTHLLRLIITGLRFYHTAPVLIYLTQFLRLTVTHRTHAFGLFGLPVAFTSTPPLPTRATVASRCRSVLRVRTRVMPGSHATLHPVAFTGGCSVYVWLTFSLPLRVCMVCCYRTHYLWFVVLLVLPDRALPHTQPSDLVAFPVRTLPVACHYPHALFNYATLNLFTLRLRFYVIPPPLRFPHTTMPSRHLPIPLPPPGPDNTFCV